MASPIGILTGILYTIMNTFNAGLSDLYGNFLAAVLIHLTGALVLWPLLFIKWGKRTRPAPWYLYFGGPLGIVTVIASNVGIMAIGLTASLAIILFGQVIASAVFDARGFFGKPPIRVNRLKMLGMATIATGALFMIISFWEANAGAILLPILLLLLSGLTIVLARISNALLAQAAGVGHSTIMNHTTGLIGSLLLFALMGFAQSTPFPSAALPWYYYIGGPMGAASVFILNHITKKLPNVQLTLLLFVGQLFSGIVMDALFLNRFSPAILAGATILALGLVLNTLGDSRSLKEAR